jgi:hypothetical protein
MQATPRPSRRLVVRYLARYLALAALLAPVGGAAGCSIFRSKGGASGPAARVTFVNQSTEQANVFAVATSGESYRIGSVPAGRTERLSIPRSVLGSGPTVSIVARRLATARGVSSGPITVRQGDEFTVTLPPSGNTLAVLPGR